ncbi:phosphate transport system regulatory protein PhoU [Siccirubricoccus deserti]|uniref:Phosphate-specific transport system accessory protein PhoU n=1 Tax=Siccirubricoccus deserti TaxID=2013562 RepID=A0A9X0UCQ6_9PROT|nr:phosphate signaling complex protein PhoU [Siccirubricoccus deserti]MBC4015549.1 phosphate signaling complex protein PhoU [Siccirubricoccus deserti]GGC42616.1 phosphate transport system regulatory protein PhoU [Siccirubricoccus deserti]
MEPKAEHTVRSYAEELRRLREMVARMGGLAERQVADSTIALVRRDAEMATEVMGRDAAIDALEREIENLCIRLLALRQPVGQDLRLVVAVLKISHDIERIGDYARNAAKRAIVVSQQPPLGSLNGFQRMAVLVQENLKGAMDALVNNDAARADEVWAADEPIDEVYNGIFREMLTFMMEDPRNITAATHLLFVAKNLERIGDHATNIAETVHYAVSGDKLPEERPKADSSAFAVVRPPA